jgi:hypothetical protein
LRPVGVPPDLLAPPLGPPDREDDFLVFAGILILLVMVTVSGERPHVHTYA